MGDLASVGSLLVSTMCTDFYQASERGFNFSLDERSGWSFSAVLNFAQFLHTTYQQFNNQFIKHKIFSILVEMGNDQEVEFHEIKICFFHEIEIMIMRSKLDLIMRSNLFNNIDQEVNTSIMRSKFQKALLGILISWSIC